MGEAEEMVRELLDTTRALPDKWALEGGTTHAAETPPPSDRDSEAMLVQWALGVHMVRVVPRLSLQWDAVGNDNSWKRIVRRSKNQRSSFLQRRREMRQVGWEHSLRTWRRNLSTTRAQVTELAAAVGVEREVGELFDQAPLPADDASREELQDAFARALPIQEEALLLLARRIDAADEDESAESG